MSGAVVTVGTFDGVHRGHQAVLAEVTRRARSRKLASVRIERFVLMPFTPAVAQLDAEVFVQRLCDEYAMRELVMGYDHGFGRGRAGDVELVQRLAQTQNFAVAVVDAVRDNGQPIASTLIRAGVAHGDLDAATRWLGRPYSIHGRVVRGAGRGRTIGVPTMNLAPPDIRKLLPPDGVYAVGGMMNQGPRPTFGEETRTLEIHLFDFDGDVYGETVQVEWVRRLRAVQAFPSRDALVAQLERDRQAARATLNR